MNIIELNEESVDYFGVACVKNRKHEGTIAKKEWLKARWKEGLKIKLLLNEGKLAGFIEFVPGKFAWRAVNAEGYLFIHCLWVYDKKLQKQGNGSLLLQDCIGYAKKEGFNGVATFASDGSWLADKRIFENNGFKVIDTKERYELMTYELKAGKQPQFRDWLAKRKDYNGLNLIYSAQCPMFVKAANDLKQTAEEAGFPMFLHELKTAGEAQDAPAGYGGFSIIYNGKLIQDYYVSKTRFNNILSKEIFTEL